MYATTDSDFEPELQVASNPGTGAGDVWHHASDHRGIAEISDSPELDSPVSPASQVTVPATPGLPVSHDD